MKHLIKAILFDFDGTLADTLPYYVEAYKITLKSFGFVLSSEEIVKQCFGRRESDICKTLGIPHKSAAFTSKYTSSIKDLFKNACLFDDTIKTLQHLKSRDIRMGIVTFQYRWYIDLMMNRLELATYFDTTLTVDDVIHPKPNPEAIIKACSFLGIKPEEVLMVGDAKSDMIMAKAAGSKSILFCPNAKSIFYDLAELKKINPDFIVSNLGEVPKIV